jgi:hypothetical protein
VGTKATGKITVSNSTGVDQPLVAATRFAAPDGKIFRSNDDATVPKAYLNEDGDKVNGTVTINVTADQAGDSYNEAPAAYTIPALSNPKITAQGAQMTGGTTKTVTVVTQSDVDEAKADLLAKDKDKAARDLQGRLPSGYMLLSASQVVATDKATPSPAVDDEASAANLVLKITYTVLAVRQSEYQSLIRAQELKQIGAQNQIYDDGLAAAQVTATPAGAGGRQTFHLTTEAYGGAKLDTKAIAASLRGKRYGDAHDLASKLPGVTRVDLDLHPGWATSVPRRTDKITITIQVAGQK